MYSASAFAQAAGSDMSMACICASPVMPGLTEYTSSLCRRSISSVCDGRQGLAADQAHLARQHVPELRQFVDLEPSQERPDRRDRSGRSLVRRHRCRACLHCPKLVASEWLCLPAETGLCKQARSPRGQPYAGDRKRHDGRRQDQQRQRHGDVDCALHGRVRASRVRSRAKAAGFRAAPAGKRPTCEDCGCERAKLLRASSNRSRASIASAVSKSRFFSSADKLLSFHSTN